MVAESVAVAVAFAEEHSGAWEEANGGRIVGCTAGGHREVGWPGVDTVAGGIAEGRRARRKG